MMLKSKKIPPVTDEYRQRYHEVLAVNAELRAENAALQAQLDGRIPEATAWLMSKVARQRAALDRLHNRVLNQRFQLRTLNALGRGLTPDEFREALDAVVNKDVTGRILEAEKIS